jgi:hypothetical protein
LLNEKAFWDLVKAALPLGDYELAKHNKNIESSLRSLTRNDLRDFIILLNRFCHEAYTWDLWAVAWIARDKFGHYGCGDDEFYAFCIGLIYQGEAVFQIAVTTPDRLAELSKIDTLKEGDPFTYLAVSIYNDLYGEMDFEPYAGHPGTPAGVEWAEDDVEYLCQHFPKSALRWGCPEVLD